MDKWNGFEKCRNLSSETYEGYLDSLRDSSLSVGDSSFNDSEGDSSLGDSVGGNMDSSLSDGDSEEVHSDRFEEACQPDK